MTEVCQCCGKPIEGGSEAVEIRIGKMASTCRYWKVDWKEKLFFHKNCDIAIPKRVVEG